MYHRQFFRTSAVTAMTVALLMVGLSPSTEAASDDVTAGKRIYLDVCKSCHGLDGKGSGEMKFIPPAADLTSLDVQSKLDSRLYNSIHNGRTNTAMGAWKHALSDEEIMQVISYVRTFGGRSSTP